MNYKLISPNQWHLLSVLTIGHSCLSNSKPKEKGGKNPSLLPQLLSTGNTPLKGTNYMWTGRVMALPATSTFKPIPKMLLSNENPISPSTVSFLIWSTPCKFIHFEICLDLSTYLQSCFWFTYWASKNLEIICSFLLTVMRFCFK